MRPSSCAAMAAAVVTLFPAFPAPMARSDRRSPTCINRVYIGGVATNSPDHLIQWIVDPQQFSPRSAMPATGISEAEARDVAAYLYAQ